MRRSLIVGNWKMNKTVSEAIDFVRAFKKSAIASATVEILLLPAFTVLYAVGDEIRGSGIKIGAQNVFIEEKNSFTGGISPRMIKDTGCSYVLIGHSECRRYLGETSEMVNKKTKAVMALGLTPLVCIGETLQERENNTTFEVIAKQIRESLVDLTVEQALSVVIAYEPVWAIGTGKTASLDQVQEVHSFVRKMYSQMYGEDVSEKIRILYGGSLNHDNISGFMKKLDVDGGLVGGASLDPESFAKLIRYSNN